MIITDESSNISSDLTISENAINEKTMASKMIEMEHPISSVENDWEILLPPSDYMEEIQNVKGGTSENARKISEDEKNFETPYHKIAENYEFDYNLNDKKEFKERDFINSLQATMNNCISPLRNINIFSVKDYIKYMIRTESEETKINADCKDVTFIGCNSIISKKRELSVEKDQGTKSVDARQLLVSENSEIRNHEIKTLEDALSYFNLTPLLEKLEISLENVRRHKQTKIAHEIVLKDIDKQIQKLSFKFHPDKVRNKGRSEEEIKTAQKLQSAINAVRTALNILNNVFLEDLDTDHRFEFYMKLELTSLANENEVKSHIYEVLFQINLLSEIKHRKITAEIQKFIAESQNCIQSYFDCKKSDFEKHRDLALFHLKCCIKGYKKLQKELGVVENKCKVEKLDNICSILRKMAKENQEMLTILRDLKRTAKQSIAGSFKIFTTVETLDEYFILPFVCYMNAILMCNTILKNKTENLGNCILKFHEIDFKPLKINGVSFTHPYLLVSAFINDELSKWLFKENMSKEKLKQEFGNYLICFSSYLKDTFKECNYRNGSMRNYFSEELKKCMNMMFDFQTKEKELSENIEKFKKKANERDDKYEKVMKKNEEFNKIIEKQVEKCKELSERTSVALSENTGMK